MAKVISFQVENYFYGSFVHIFGKIISRFHIL